MQIAVRELKNRLSAVLAQARAGEVVEVRSHNVPIARIVGIPALADRNLPEGILRLAAEGALTLGDGRKFEDFEPLRLPPGGKSMSDIVIEDRG